MRKPVVELFQSFRNGKWYFHKRSTNGKITLPSQGYTRKSSAKRAARRDIPSLEIVEIVS